MLSYKIFKSIEFSIYIIFKKLKYCIRIPIIIFELIWQHYIRYGTFKNFQYNTFFREVTDDNGHEVPGGTGLLGQEGPPRVPHRGDGALPPSLCILQRRVGPRDMEWPT